GFAQDSGGLALVVAIDLPAVRIRGLCGDARSLERGAVGDGDMPVHAVEDRRMIAGDGVEVLANGRLLYGPQRMVPAAAGDPLAPRGRFGARGNALLHLVE